jgi:hypothetical protein
VKEAEGCDLYRNASAFFAFGQRNNGELEGIDRLYGYERECAGGFLGEYRIHAAHTGGAEKGDIQ